MPRAIVTDKLPSYGASLSSGATPNAGGQRSDVDEGTHRGLRSQACRTRWRYWRAGILFARCRERLRFAAIRGCLCPIAVAAGLLRCNRDCLRKPTAMRICFKTFTARRDSSKANALKQLSSDSDIRKCHRLFSGIVASGLQVDGYPCYKVAIRGRNPTVIQRLKTPPPTRHDYCSSFRLHGVTRSVLKKLSVRLSAMPLLTTSNWRISCAKLFW